MLVVLLTFSSLIGYGSPAGATPPGVDLLDLAPTGWTSSVAGGGCTVGGACDGSDATGIRADGNDGDGNSSGQAGYWFNFLVGWTRASGVTSFDISSMRLLVKTCASGDDACTGATLDMDRVIVREYVAASCTGAVVADDSYSAAATIDTGYFDITPTTISNNEGFCVNVHAAIQNTSQWFMAFSTEAYSEAIGPETGDMEDYVFRLKAESSLFAKTISWGWAKSWTGTWTLARARTTPSVDTTVIASGSDPSATNPVCTTVTASGLCAGHSGGEYISDPCGLDGCSGWLLTVNDTGDDVIATYEIADDAEGTLIATVTGIRFGGVSACYNADFEQCGTGQLAATVTVTYSILPTTEGDDVLVTIGSQYLYGPGFDGDPWYTDTVAGGTHTVNMATAVPYPVGGQNLLLVAVGPHNTVQYVYEGIDWVDGGSARPVVIADPQNPNDNETCTFGDVGCFLRNLGDDLGAALADIWDIAADALMVPVTAAVNTLRDLAMTKQPFNFIVRGIEGVTAQVERALDDVGSEDDCPGYTMTFPGEALPYWPEGEPEPSWTVLACADFEPLVATSQYQAIRGAMDPAIYLFFAYQQLRRLQPRPVLNG